METIIYQPNEIETAAELLKQGQLIAFPTETVYGLGADATNEEAVKQVYAAKGRPSDNPLIVHVADVETVREYAQPLTANVEKLIKTFWPGSLTLILKLKAGALSKTVTGGLETAAFRMPDNKVTLDFIIKSGVPIVGPSANTSGKPSPTMAEHVAHDLNGKIAGIIDDGQTKVGVESTVLDMSTDEPTILRPGAVTQSQIEYVIGHVSDDTHEVAEGETPKAPGMKYRHYAPRAQVAIVDSTQNWSDILDWVAKQDIAIGLMAKEGQIDTDQIPKNSGYSSLGKTIESASQSLFDGLRYFDDNPNVQMILVEGFDKKGLGVAYMNRLEKAASSQNIVELMDAEKVKYKQQDKELWDAIAHEEKRQEDNIELIASENIVSDAVRAAQGSVLTNKYAEGYPNKRYYGGCEYIDVVEQLAIDRAKALFHAEYANVQPHSGSQANMAVYQAFLEPQDKILGMKLNDGGHLTHGSPVNFSGELYNFVSYGVDSKTERLNYDAIREIALKEKPKMIIAGASAYSRMIDFTKFRSIADEVGAYLMVDMAHIAGLVATGLHPNPVDVADVVTTTTHKTLRGPRGGMILAKEKYAKKLNSAVFPGTQGGPLEHVIAGKAAAFYEAAQPAFTAYMYQVVQNSQAMAGVFAQSDLVRVISGGTDNHLMNLDVTPSGLNGKEVQNLLDRVHITVNKNTIPNESLSPFKTSGIRIGTPAISTRGFDSEDVKVIAILILYAIQFHDDDDKLAEIGSQVLALSKKHPISQIKYV